MKILSFLDRVLALCSVAALSALTLMVTVSVVGRYVFGQPVPDDVVLGELLMLPIVYLPMAAVQARREHIFVSLFTDSAPRRVRAMLEVLGMLIGAGFFGVIAYAACFSFLDSVETGAYRVGLLDMPEYPGRLALFLGTGLFAARLLIDAFRAMLGQDLAGGLPGERAAASADLE